MSPARSLTTPFVMLALRRAIPIWVGVLLVSVAVLAFAGALHRLWSLETALWSVAMGGSCCLPCANAPRWRESSLLGNLGVPRATLTALAGAAELLIEVAVQRIVARVLA